MPENTTPSNELVIKAPKNEETAVYQLSPGQHIRFQFDTEGALFANQGNDLIITLENGTKVVLEGYLPLAQQDSLSNFELFDGEQLPGNSYLFAFNEIGAEDDELETAADSLGGSGIGSYSDNTGDLYESVGRLDPQDSVLAGTPQADDPEDLTINPITASGDSISGPISTGALALEMNEDGTLDVTDDQVLATFFNPNDAPMTVVNITTSTGTIVKNNNGTWSFTPPENFNGNVVLTYTVDNGIAPITEAGSIEVAPVDDAATFTGDDAGSVTEDEAISVSGNLIATDVDATTADGVQPKSIDTDYGSFEIDASGAWTYTLNNDAPLVQGLDADSSQVLEEFTVKSVDGTEHTVTVTINGTEDKPSLFEGDSGAVTEDNTNSNDQLETAGTLTFEDKDFGESEVVPADEDNPLVGQYGSLTIDAQGNWNYKAANIQKLAAGESLEDSVTVTTADGTEHQITITIHGAEDNISVQGTETAIIGEDVTSSVGGQLTASDLDHSDGPSFEIITEADALAGEYGSLTIDGEGNWTYTPTLDSGGTPLANELGSDENHEESFTVNAQVLDDDGNVKESVPQEIKVTVQGSDDAATFTGDDAGSVTEDEAISVSGNLVATDVDATTPDEVQPESIDTDYGSFKIDASGAWTYTLDNDAPLVQGLDADSSPVLEKFTVKSVDGTEHTVTVNINGTEDKPSLFEGDYGTVTEDETNSSGLLETAGTLTFEDKDFGESEVVPAGEDNPLVGEYGSLTIDAQGNWNYRAANMQGLAEGESLQDSVTVETADGTEHQITITISGAEDGISVQGTSAAGIDEGATASVGGQLTATDLDVSDDPSFEIITDNNALAGKYGSLTIDAEGNWTYTPTLDSDGNPLANELGSGKVYETFTVNARVFNNDGSIKETVPQEIKVAVQGSNDAPVAEGRSFSSSNYGSVGITLNTAVSDVEDDADALNTSVRITSLPADGSLTYSGEVTLADQSTETWDNVVIDGNHAYKDADNRGILFNDPDGFNYKANDTAPGVLLGSHNSADNALANWGTLDGGKLTNDLGGGISVTVEGTGNGLQFFDNPHPSHIGAGLGIKGSDGIKDGDEVTVSFDGASTSFAKVGFDGMGGHFTGADNLAQATWKVFRTDENNQRIDVTPLDENGNYPEVWDKGTVDYFEDVAITARDGGPFDTIVFSTDSDSGSNWTLRYVDAEFTHNDSFSYRAEDSSGATSDEAKVDIVIEPDGTINEAPESTDNVINYSLEEDGSILLDGAFIASQVLTDEDNTASDYSISSLSINNASGQISETGNEALTGELSDNGDGTWTFTPTANWNGTLDLDYTLSDGTHDFSGTARVAVNAVNDLPTGNDFTVDMVENPQSVEFSINTQDNSANVSDIESADSSVQVYLTDLPQNGTLEYTDPNDTTFSVTADMLYGESNQRLFDQDGTFSYTPDGSENRPVNGLLLGTRNAETVDIANWGEATADPKVRQVNLDDGKTITIRSDSKALEQYNAEDPSHMGIGLGDQDGQGINRGENIIISFDGTNVSVAEIGFDGLGGHFDADGSVKATATWVAYQDGREVGSGSVTQPDDGSLFNSITIGAGDHDLGGNSFDKLAFSTNSSQNSNWELRYVDTEFANTDSVSYRPFDGTDVGAEKVITLSQNAGALSHDKPEIDLDGDTSYLEVSFEKTTASFNNMFGAYAVDTESGEPIGDPVLLINNQNAGIPQGHVVGTLPEGAHYEYFLIARGADIYPDLQDNQLSFDTSGEKLLLQITDPETGKATPSQRPVYFSQTQHNPDNLDDPDAPRTDSDGNPLPSGHFVIESKGDATIVRVEDLADGGDNDYEDVVVRIESVEGTAGINYSAEFIEDAGSVSISSPAVSITDPDSTAMQSATIELSDWSEGDTFIIGNLPDYIIAAQDQEASTLTVTLSANTDSGLAPTNAFEEAINSVKFYNDSENPVGGERNISVSVTDESGLTSDTSETAIKVYPRNDAPSLSFTGATGDNLVTNGSFEYEVVDPSGDDNDLLPINHDVQGDVENTGWAGADGAPAGWTKESGSRWEVMGGNRHGIEGASDGDRVLDMGVGNEPLVISQQITGLAQGQEYVIQLDLFDRSSNLNSNKDSGKIKVFFGDSEDPIATINPGDTDWETLTATVVADSASQTLRIASTDGDSYGSVIDNVRMYALETTSTATIKENSLNGTFVATARGADEEGSVTYELLNQDSSPFGIDQKTGNITVKDPSSLNYEDKTSHTIRVQVRDEEGASSERSFSIDVENVNEAPLTAAVDLGQIDEGASITFSADDLIGQSSDPDGNSLRINGDITLDEGQGTLSFDDNTNEYTFTPSTNWNGAVKLTYDVSDGTLSTPSSASLDVQDVDTAPTLTIGTGIRDDNLITNGSFEFAQITDQSKTQMTVETDPDAGASNSAWAGGEAPAGWTLLEGDRWEVMGSNRHGIGLDSPDGTANVIDTGVGSGEALVISQEIQGLKPSSEYVIELDLMDRGDRLNQSDSGDIDLFLGNKLIASFNPGEHNWESGSVVVTIPEDSNGTETLKIASYNADSYGNVIDNVRMYPVSPASLDDGKAVLDVAEDIQEGSFIARAIGSDNDSTDIEYSLKDGEQLPFQIDEHGAITLKPGASLDYETTPYYELEVLAKSHGKSVSHDLKINVTDINEAPHIVGAKAPVETFDNQDVTGWTGDVRVTENNDVSDFLGRFSTGDSVQKVFAVADNTKTMKIEFDLYEIDSWDQFGENHKWGNDDVIITINEENINIPLEVGRNNNFEDDDSERTGTSNGISWTITPKNDGTDHLGLGSGEMDQIYHVTLSLDNPEGPVTLGFSTTANEGINNESFGIDNVTSTTLDADGNATFAVPENISQDTNIAVLDAMDPEGDDVQFTIQSVMDHSGNPVKDFNELFSIQDNTLVAKAGNFNHESTPLYTVKVVPEDSPSNGEASKTGEPFDIVVNINDVNEAPALDLNDTGESKVFNKDSDSWGYNALGLYTIDENGEPKFVRIIQEYSDEDGADSEFAEFKYSPDDLLTQVDGTEDLHFFVLTSGLGQNDRTGPEFKQGTNINFVHDGEGWLGKGTNEENEEQTFRALFDNPELNPSKKEHFRFTEQEDGTVLVEFEEGKNNDWDDVRFTVQTNADSDGTGNSTTYQEGSDGVSIGNNINITDVDSATLSKAVITLTNPEDGDALRVAEELGLTSEINRTDDAITITLTGEAAISEYEIALEGITFSTTSSSDNTKDRRIEVQVTDNSGDNSATSNIAATTIQVEKATAAGEGRENYDVRGGQEISVVAADAGYANMLGVYSLGDDGKPKDPQIIVPNSHDTHLPEVILAADETVRFFLIPDGANKNIDLTKDLSFEEVNNGNDTYWELKIGPNEGDQIDIKFDNPSLNPNDEEDGFWGSLLDENGDGTEPHQSKKSQDDDFENGFVASENDTVEVRIDDIFDGPGHGQKQDGNPYNGKSKNDDDDDFNDLILNVTGGTENGIFHGTDANDVAYGGDGNDLLNGGAGDDFLVGGHGQDLIFAGDGNNTIEASGGDIINLGENSEGTDTIIVDPSVLAYEKTQTLFIDPSVNADETTDGFFIDPAVRNDTPNALVINNFEDGDVLKFMGDTEIKDITFKSNDSEDLAELLVGQNDSDGNDFMIKLMGVEQADFQVSHVDITTQADDTIQQMIDSANSSEN